MKTVKIRELVATLPQVDSEDEFDSIWCRHVSVFGYTEAMNEPEYGDFRRVTTSNVQGLPVVLIDPNEVLYSGQALIRLDALAHYLDNDELFDSDPWYGVSYPVISPFKDSYIIVDGNHRLTAARLTGRMCEVIIASQQLHGP